MYKFLFAIFILFFFQCSPKKAITTAEKKTTVVVWQPSHQTDTGKDFSEAEVCNGIAEAAMATVPSLNEHKVWSLGRTDLHHANAGSNTMRAHTTDIIDGKISGYAWELKTSNEKKPDVFISIHNNGGTKRHAVWGFIHAGDKYEADNRELAGRLIKAIAAVTTLENRGVVLDSTTGRNDYRCINTGARAFFSLDENVNTAPYRVLLEIGDNAASYDFLRDPANQKIMGEAIKKELVDWMRLKGL